MKRRVAIVVMMLIGAAVGYAQDTMVIYIPTVEELSESEGAKGIDFADYQKQYAKIYKEYQKDPKSPLPLQQLAEFYGRADNPACDYALAMNLINRAEKRYIVLLEDDKYYKEVNRLIKKKITIYSIRKKRQEIVNGAAGWIDEAERIDEGMLDRLNEAFKGYPELSYKIEDYRFEQRYKVALQQNTLEGYRQFIKTYPNTKQSEKAEQAMGKKAAELVSGAKDEEEVDKLLSAYYDYSSVSLAGTERKSAIAYAALMKRPSPEGYREFLTRYPGSNEYVLVLNKMDELLHEQYATLRTAKEYSQFAQQNEDSELADKAIEQLKKMIENERDPEAVKEYLTHFPLDASYNDIYLSYYKWHTEEGNLSPLEQFAKENPKFPYQIALAEDMEVAREYDKIDINKPFVETDFRKWASKIYHLTGKKESYVGLQRTLQQLIATRQWKKAIERIDYFALCFESDCVKEVAELKEILMNETKSGRTRNGVVVPSYDINRPVMSIDGKRLYYNKKEEGRWVIMQARPTRGKKTVWRSEGAIRFDNLENSGLRIYSLYHNDQRMLLGRDGDIMVAEWKDSVWSWKETLASPVNSGYNDYDAVMTTDETGILFASDRPNGHNLQPSKSYFHGDTALASDIYYVPYQNGQWGEAVNLGIGVNSQYMECSPALSADKKTLYFVTDGRGLGYGDIYCATRDNVEDWGHWNRAQNCGREVNTGFDEASVYMVESRKQLILSSNSSKHYGCYSVDLREGADGSLTTVSFVAQETGYVADVYDETGRSCLVRSQQVARASQWQSGFTAEKRYLLLPSCEGLYMPGIAFTPAVQAQIVPKAYDATTLLQRADENRALPLVAAVFEAKESNLCSATKCELEHLGDFLRRNPTLSVELIVSAAGDNDTDCYRLSQERGRQIKDYLITKGIEDDRISISAYGNSLTKNNNQVVPLALLFHRQ